MALVKMEKWSGNNASVINGRNGWSATVKIDDSQIDSHQLRMVAAELIEAANKIDELNDAMKGEQK